MVPDQAKPVVVPESSSWEDCVGIFKAMDAMMGSAFHAKVQAMGIARKRYFEEHGKNAGFVKKFSEDAGVSYSYARKINRIEETLGQCTVSNFSHDAAIKLLELPPEDREEFLENHVEEDEPITVTDVKRFKEERRPAPVVTTYTPDPDEEDNDQSEVIEAIPAPRQEKYQEPLKQTAEGVTASLMTVFWDIGTRFSGDEIIECVLEDITDKAKANPKLVSLCKARAQAILDNRETMERLFERLEDALQDPIFQTQRIN